MKQAELALLIKTGTVDRVVIFRARDEAGGWQVFAYGEDGCSVPGVSRDWMEPSRETCHRTWASLDTAHAWLKTMGWDRTITVDG